MEQTVNGVESLELNYWIPVSLWHHNGCAFLILWSRRPSYLQFEISKNVLTIFYGIICSFDFLSAKHIFKES